MPTPDAYPHRSGRSDPPPDTASFVHEKALALLEGEAPGALLDVPAGAGAFALRAGRLGYAVTCGDIDRSRFSAEGLKCEQVDLNQPWPYGNECFDVVACIEAIEHLENPWLLVREAKRVLKRGGVLLVTTPNVLSIKSRVSYLFNGYPDYFYFGVIRGPGSREEQPIDHINPVGFLELRHILVRNGFRIETVETNRYVYRNRLFSKIVKLFAKKRWRRRTRKNLDESELRTIMLSPALLYGEILIVKVRKGFAAEPA
jgi:SAM-dependent methyltransferase